MRAGGVENIRGIRRRIIHPIAQVSFVIIKRRNLLHKRRQLAAARDFRQRQLRILTVVILDDVHVVPRREILRRCPRCSPRPQKIRSILAHRSAIHRIGKRSQRRRLYRSPCQPTVVCDIVLCSRRIRIPRLPLPQRSAHRPDRVRIGRSIRLATRHIKHADWLTSGGHQELPLGLIGRTKITLLRRCRRRRSGQRRGAGLRINLVRGSIIDKRLLSSVGRLRQLVIHVTSRRHRLHLQRLIRRCPIFPPYHIGNVIILHRNGHVGRVIAGRCGLRPNRHTVDRRRNRLPQRRRSAAQHRGRQKTMRAPPYQHFLWPF